MLRSCLEYLQVQLRENEEVDVEGLIGEVSCLEYLQVQLLKGDDDDEKGLIRKFC
jgi:hypothetical protein